MDKCYPCTERQHQQCVGGLDWCECPCWTGELTDPTRPDYKRVVPPSVVLPKQTRRETD